MHSYELGVWKGYHLSIEGIRKLVRKQSSCSSKLKYWYQTFFKAKCSTRQCFSFRNFTYNSHETCLSDTSGYFVKRLFCHPGDLTWDFEPFLPVSRLESEITCSRLRDSRAHGIEKFRKRKKTGGNWVEGEAAEKGRQRNAWTFFNISLPTISWNISCLRFKRQSP